VGRSVVGAVPHHLDLFVSSIEKTFELRPNDFASLALLDDVLVRRVVLDRFHVTTSVAGYFIPSVEDHRQETSLTDWVAVGDVRKRLHGESGEARDAVR